MQNYPEENVFVGLGSNKGDRRSYIHRAFRYLKEHADIDLIDESTIIETDPIGESLETPFLNAVVRCHTRLPPELLLKQLERIERKLGRRKKGMKAPRTIDLDLLFYGQRMIKKAGLQVPHPEAHRRAFVLEPMKELAPDFQHPERKKSIKELYFSLLR